MGEASGDGLLGCLEGPSRRLRVIAINIVRRSGSRGVIDHIIIANISGVGEVSGLLGGSAADIIREVERVGVQLFGESTRCGCTIGVLLRCCV